MLFNFSSKPIIMIAYLSQVILPCSRSFSPAILASRKAFDISFTDSIFNSSESGFLPDRGLILNWPRRILGAVRRPRRRRRSRSQRGKIWHQRKDIKNSSLIEMPRGMLGSCTKHVLSYILKLKGFDSRWTLHCAGVKG